MKRLADIECEFCGERAEELINKAHGEPMPKRVAAHCGHCFNLTPHSVLISAPAKYLGEKNLSPHVYGGRFDTMGHRAGPDLPDLPGAATHGAFVAKKLAALGPDASTADRKAVLAETMESAPSSADYAALFSTPEYRERMAERKRIGVENKAKRARAAAFARGETVNFRRDKVAGDPNMAA